MPNKNECSHCKELEQEIVWQRAGQDVWESTGRSLAAQRDEALDWWREEYRKNHELKKEILCLRSQLADANRRLGV